MAWASWGSQAVIGVSGPPQVATTMQMEVPAPLRSVAGMSHALTCVARKEYTAQTPVRTCAAPLPGNPATTRPARPGNLAAARQRANRPAVEQLPSAKHEVWVLGPQTPVGGRRATRVDEPAAWGVREHARAPPSPSTLCALSAQAIHAAQGQLGREGRGWYPRTQLEEELDLAAR